MTVANVLLIICFGILLIFNKKIKGVWLDGFFYVMTPYVVIITLNNTIATKYAFYAIKDYVINIHVLAMVLFFIGSIIGFFFSKRYRIVIRKGITETRKINIKATKSVAIVAQTIIIVDMVVRFIRYGSASLVSDSEEFNAGFFAGHALVLLVPIAIILIFCAIERKDKSAWILGIISMVCIASSFVKYHIIGEVLALFIYLAIKKPKVIIKAAAIIGGTIVALFVGNYIISFAVNKTTGIDQNFYFYHLWKYIAGSTINFDAVNLMYNSKNGLSIGLWLLQNLMSFPNMFLQKILGHNIPNYMMQIPYIAVGTTYETSNVISMIASMFIQSNLVAFSIIVLLWGGLVEYARERCFNTKSECKRIILCIFVTFNLLSFFGSFFVKSAVWEMMIDTALLYFIFGKGENLDEKNSVHYI